MLNDNFYSLLTNDIPTKEVETCTDFYSIVNSENNSIIVCDVLGIDKKDLKLVVYQKLDGIYLKVSGITKNKITKKYYEINASFALDDTQLDLTKITSNMENGLLYITIPVKKEQPKNFKTINIEIL